MTGHPFTGPGQVAPDRPTPDTCMICGQPEATHGTGPRTLEQLSAEAGVRQLEQIRLVLDAFDWEHDDRQYALEQIDDIMRGDR